MRLLTSILFIYLWQNIYTFSITDSSFCCICQCDINNNINCTGVQFDNNPFNESSFWFDEKAAASYPIQRLSINKCGLSRVFRIPINSSSITTLDLSMNRIQLIDKYAFKYLQNMTELNLSNNELTSSVFYPEIFEGLYYEGEYLPLKSLKILRLADNELHTLHQDTFEHLTDLEVLDLGGNPFKIIDTQTTIAITNLPYLRELDLSYTSLTKLPDHIFHSPKNMKILNLAGNSFTKIPSQIGEAHNLEFLSLNENPIVNITKHDGFPILKKLKILHLCYMADLEIIEDNSMSGLWGLRELHVSDNGKLHHIGKNALSRIEEGAESEIWPQVKKILLKNNKLSYLDSHLLARWDILDDIDISDNAWACECENQWIFDTIIPYIEEKKIGHTEGLICASPSEMEGIIMMEIYKKNETLRCLDLYAAHPERDAAIVVGVLVGLLLGIPAILGLLYCHKRNWFGQFDAGPASFSRKFYSRTADDMDFDA